MKTYDTFQSFLPRSIRGTSIFCHFQFHLLNSLDCQLSLFSAVIATPNLQSLLCIDIVLSFMRDAHYYDVGWLLSIRYCYSFPLDRPPRVRATTFHPCHCLIYLTVLVQYWTSLCFASLSTPIRPSLWDFCSSVQVFASGFLQIPPHDGHPCLWLMIPTVKAHSGLSPPSCRPCRAHKKATSLSLESGLTHKSINSYEINGF